MKQLISIAIIMMLGGTMITAGEKDDQAIQKVVDSMEDGWNNKNGEQFASGFATQHDYIIINGIRKLDLTPAKNAAQHQYIFDTIYRDTEMEYKLVTLRYLTNQIVIAHIDAFLYEQGKRENAHKATISLVFQKSGDEWKIVSFQNTRLQAPKDNRQISSDH
ncbi:MAG: SgcJ/EcaC family oxidoreductase [Calditrichia bacterium]